MRRDGGHRAVRSARGSERVQGRGLHSSTFRLNISAFCGTGVHMLVVEGVFRRCQGVFRVYFVSETAQVEQRSGRL